MEVMLEALVVILVAAIIIGMISFGIYVAIRVYEAGKRYDRKRDEFDEFWREVREDMKGKKR